MRVQTHPTSSTGRQFRDLWSDFARIFEEILRLVALHPVFEHLEMVRMLLEICHRHLVGAPGPFDGLPVHYFRSRPAFGRTQADHWPARPPVETVPTRFRLNRPDLGEHADQCRSHKLLSR